MARKKKRRYTREQKAEAVRLVRVSGMTIADVARDLDIPPNTLWNWTQQAKVDAGEGTPEQMTTDEKKELARLRRDNRRLRMERDFLKKAAAFFARDGEDDLS